MNEKIRIIRDRAILEAGESNPGNEEFLWELFAKMIVAESVGVVKNTGTQCAFTTYDLGTVKCTIDKCADTLENYFKE